MKTIIASALLAAATLPLAAQEIVPYDDHFVSTRSRAQVAAEASQATAAGMLDTQGEIVSYPGAGTSRSSLTRSEVLADLARAAAAGELSPQNEISPETGFAMGDTRKHLASGSPVR